jgi:hypothetical protein
MRPSGAWGTPAGRPGQTAGEPSSRDGAPQPSAGAGSETAPISGAYGKHRVREVARRRVPGRVGRARAEGTGARPVSSGRR